MKVGIGKRTVEKLKRYFYISKKLIQQMSLINLLMTIILHMISLLKLTIFRYFGIFWYLTYFDIYKDKSPIRIHNLRNVK
jgi:hypothetical protein